MGGIRVCLIAGDNNPAHCIRLKINNICSFYDHHYPVSDYLHIA